jgi:hypothetical protein
MTARRDSSIGPGVGSLGGRALLVGAVVFAAAATGLLVLTDQEKWLRLGIVAALWAALAGAFLAARYRRQVTDQREAAAERQQIYELELEREIAARREHELTVEAEAKRKAEETSRDDIAALRGELQNMRQTLESLLGGEFLVERYALRAESTRMRSLGEDRSLAVHRDVKHLPAAGANSGNMVIPPVVREAETEMIERVREVQVHPKPRREQPPVRPEPRVPDSRPPSVPRGPARPEARPERPTPEPVKPAARPDQPAAAAHQTAIVPHPAEVSDRWFVPDGLADSAPQPPRRSEQPRRQEPRPADPAPRRATTPGWDDGEQEWAPSWEKQQQAPARRPEPARAHDQGVAAGHDTGTHLSGAADRTGSWLSQYNKPEPSEPTYGSRAYVPKPQASQPMPLPQPSQPMPLPQPSQPLPRPQQPSQPLPRPQQSQPLPKTPSLRMPENPSLRNVWAEGQNNRGQAPAPTEEGGGGRRRRAEGQPSWQETVGHRAEETGGGSHASGRSVSELLANHGHDTSPRRRRRRED